METHKAVVAFLRTTIVRIDPSIVPRTLIGQRGGLSNCRTGGNVIGQGGGLAGDGYVQGPAV